MADKVKQIKEFPGKQDFGDDDLLLIQGQGTTYHVRGDAVKRYAENAAAPQVELARKEAAAAAAAADRAEEAIQHPAVPDPVTKNWMVWNQEAGSYAEVTPPVRAEGQDFEIKGYYPTLEALEAAVPNPEKGYAYGVGTEAPYDIYVWDMVHGEWVNNGPMTASGDMLKSTYDPQHKNQDIFAYADAAKQAALDADVGRSMAGQTVEPTQGATVTAEYGAEIFNDYRERTYGTDEGYETVVPLLGNIASGRHAHAEGVSTTATGNGAHAEGNRTLASGANAHAEGGTFNGDKGCIASGYGSHAEGVSTTASASGAHAEGRSTKAEGIGAHAEGELTTASKNDSHAEGYETRADGTSAHAEGRKTKAIGHNSHAEGLFGTAEGDTAHVEGGYITDSEYNKASGYAAHAEGSSTLASGDQSHAEGVKTVASAINSHAEGCRTKTENGNGNHAEGIDTTASGLSGAHAEGSSGTASGSASHVEGGYIDGKPYNIASGYASHAEGASTLASASEAHAEGRETVASGSWTHSEGVDTIASGDASHAEGIATRALGTFSHSAGQETVAEYHSETVIGSFNVEKNLDSYNYLGDLFVVGKGSSSTSRSNAFRVNHVGVFGTAAFNASGADYAELFEWADGNPDAVDRVGRFVTLDGPRIRLASPSDDYILGIVSGNPSVVGDVYDDQWQGMYLTDVYGRPVWEDVEVPAVTETVKIPVEVEEPDGDISTVGYREDTREIIPAHTERRQKLNPAYDHTQPYVPRTERPEWAAVGMLGKLVAVEDGSCRVNGWATVGEGGEATASEARTRFRVMEKMTDPETGRKCVRILIL